MKKLALLAVLATSLIAAPSAAAKLHYKSFNVGTTEIAWKSKTVFPRANPDIGYRLDRQHMSLLGVRQSGSDCRLTFYGDYVIFRVNSCGRRIRVRAIRLGAPRRYRLRMRY